MVKILEQQQGQDCTRFFLKAMWEHVNILQVRGYVDSENRLISKCVMLLQINSYHAHRDGMSTHSTRIECFWRERITTVKDHF